MGQERIKRQRKTSMGLKLSSAALSRRKPCASENNLNNNSEKNFCGNLFRQLLPSSFLSCCRLTCLREISKQLTKISAHYFSLFFLSRFALTYQPGEYRNRWHQRQFPNVRVEHCENFGAGECWAGDAIVCRVGERSWLRKEWHCHLSFIHRRLGALVKRKSRHIECPFIRHDVQQSLQHWFDYGSSDLIAASWLWNLTTSYVDCHRNRLGRAAIVIEPYNLRRSSGKHWVLLSNTLAVNFWFAGR